MPSSDPLVQFSDLVYQYAIHLPNVGSVDADSFHYAGAGLVYYPAHDSLFVAGFELAHKVAEVSIPSSAGTATILQGLVDITEGHINEINPTDPNDKRIGGLLPWSTHLVTACYSYYDGSATQVLSHFVSGLTLATPSDVTGPYQVGVSPVIAGYVSGYMGVVPSAWRTALGGPAFTGNCDLAIVYRTSSGPALCTFDPADLGSTIPAPAAPVLYYDVNHPLRPYNSTNLINNGSTKIKAVVMPEGTRSVLFFGRHGIGTFGYGPGTLNQSLDGQLVGTGPDHYCYDPEDQSKGTHAYPYVYQCWAYDANLLAEVKAGTRQPWDVQPYGVWQLTFPTSGTVTQILGAAYDAAGGRLFLSQARADGTKPVIHVYTLGAGSTPPPTPTITTTALPFGTVGTAYAATFTGSSGTAPYTWAANGLPPGLALGGATMSGTPTTAGSFSVSITLTDALAAMAFKTCPLSIAAGTPPPPPPPTMTIATTAPLSGGVVGSAYVATLATINGTFPFTWTVASGLPPGLAVSGSTIAGTPTLAGVYPFTLSVTDSTSPTPQTATQAQSITVTPPPTPPATIVITTTSPLADGIVGDAYTATLANTNGTGPFTWSVGSGLPPGLSVSGATITGTLTVPGVYLFTVTVTDSATPHQVATKPLSITVTAPAPTPPPPATVQSVDTSPVQWQLKLEDVAPDAFGNWSVQFYRSQGNRLGTKATAAPYVRSDIVAAGTYRPYGVWTKTGQATVTRSEIKVVISSTLAPSVEPTSSVTVQAVTVTPVKWSLKVTDVPPDATGGWSVQFYRDSGVKFGKADSSSPYTRSGVVGKGTYAITGVWTKPGQPTVTRTATVLVLP